MGGGGPAGFSPSRLHPPFPSTFYILFFPLPFFRCRGSIFHLPSPFLSPSVPFPCRPSPARPSALFLLCFSLKLLEHVCACVCAPTLILPFISLNIYIHNSGYNIPYFIPKHSPNQPRGSTLGWFPLFSLRGPASSRRVTKLGYPALGRTATLSNGARIHVFLLLLAV